MAEGLFWFLLLLCGFHAPQKAVSVHIVGVPSETELTQEFIRSERLHTGNIPATVDLPDGSEGYGVKADDVSAAFNLDVSGTVNLNKIVDEMLDTLRVDIIQRGKDRINIPDVRETFKKKVGFITVKGKFEGENGWVKNFSTVHRTADVVASSSGRFISVSCGFGIGDLEFGYDNYAVKVMRLGTEGKLNATVGENSILLNATVTWANHTCNITLDALSLNQFGELVLDVTGLGYMNWLFSKISTWALHHFQSEIKGRIEYTLREEAEKYLSNFDCSRYFPKP
jgi:hypothetical protein